MRIPSLPKSPLSLAFLFMCAILFSFPTMIAAEEAEIAIGELESSQIKLIDNFDSQNKTNKIGGEWSTRLSENGRLQFDYRSEDVLGSIRGSALRIIYTVPANDEVALHSDLNDLDISQAREMRFWIRRALEDEHRLWIELSDSGGNSARLEIKRYSLAENESGWQEIRIPRKKFQGVNFESLKTLRLLIQGEDVGEASGIFFFRPPYFFRQTRSYF